MTTPGLGKLLPRSSGPQIDLRITVEPEEAVRVAATTSLPLVTEPIVLKVEFLLQDDVYKQLISRVEVLRRDMRILPQ